MTILDPRPRERVRAPPPSPQAIRAIRAQRAREQQYREYANFMQSMSGTAAHFAGLGGYPKHFGDAGGSGATLPEEVTVDPTGTGARAAAGELLKNPLATLPVWVQVGVFAGLGIGALFAVGYIARSFR